MSVRDQIKTIPTAYNGIQFRSRLEARWAVFFDEMGFRYYYEYEGFDIDGRWYVPDFYLPDVWDGMYCEVKPYQEHVDRSIFSIPKHTGKCCALLQGPPERREGYVPNSDLEWDQRYLFSSDEEPPDHFYDFSICRVTGKLGFTYEGQRRWERISGLEWLEARNLPHVYEGDWYAKMSSASGAAMKKRFH